MIRPGKSFRISFQRESQVGDFLSEKVNAMNSRVKSQNLSIMLTDIQGYSKTSASVSRQEIVQLIRRHNQLMIPVIEFYGGRIIKSIGDAFLCTFQSATDAVICAIIIQLLLREYNHQQKQENQQLNLRVIVHSGDVSIEGDDIFGDAVNVTSRIESLECFPGGSIGISETTYLLMDKSEIVAEKIGPQKLKDIEQKVTVFRVPLERQKLTGLPVHLLKLVEKVVNADADDSSSNQLTEWTSNVINYLKEKNWGQNIGQLTGNLEFAKKQLGQNIGQVQDQLSKTFGKKTVLEKRGAGNLNPASIKTRAKCVAIDLAIIVSFAILAYISWWPVQRVLFGKTSITMDEYDRLDYSVKGDWYYSHQGRNTSYVRSMGLVEKLVDINVSCPIFLVWLYFTIFWKIKGATPGQIAGNSAVVTDAGSPLDWVTAAKRGGLIIVTLLTFGLAALTIFTPKKKTFHEIFSGTLTVE